MNNKNTKKPWVGRFKDDLNLVVQEFSQSLHLDRRLASYDIQGSRAHVRMLATREIISEQDKDSILDGLNQIEQEIKSDEFPYREELEDIHMNIECRLQEIVGEAGGRIHTGRSQLPCSRKMKWIKSGGRAPWRLRRSPKPRRGQSRWRAQGRPARRRRPGAGRFQCAPRGIDGT